MNKLVEGKLENLKLRRYKLLEKEVLTKREEQELKDFEVALLLG